MEVRGKDTSILIDCTVLDDDLVKLRDIYHILESLVEEIYLEIERPSLHIFIEISKIRIIIH
jgi:hypothetical protein